MKAEKDTKSQSTTNVHENWPKDYKLGPVSRAIWDFLVVFVGTLPGLIGFYIWVERNCRLPNLSGFSLFPYVFGDKSTLSLDLAWNAALFLSFGIVHSALAHPVIHKKLEAVFPPQTMRSIFIISTGLNLTFIMMNWRLHDIYLWKFTIVNETITNLVSMVTFWSIYGVDLITTYNLGMTDFIGLDALQKPVEEVTRTVSLPELVTTGIFGVVRHPMYLVSFLSFGLSPVMTLDRFWVIVIMACYYSFAIPLEEQKLIKLYGKAYEDYKKTTPSLIPSWTSLSREISRYFSKTSKVN